MSETNPPVPPSLDLDLRPDDPLLVRIADDRVTGRAVDDAGRLRGTDVPADGTDPRVRGLLGAANPTDDPAHSGQITVDWGKVRGGAAIDPGTTPPPTDGGGPDNPGEPGGPTEPTTPTEPTRPADPATPADPDSTPATFAPAVYTPGEPFVLTRGAEGAQLLRLPQGDRIPGTGYIANPRAGDDLEPVLAAAELEANVDYYVAFNNAPEPRRLFFRLAPANAGGGVVGSPPGSTEAPDDGTRISREPVPLRGRAASLQDFPTLKDRDDRGRRLIYPSAHFGDAELREYLRRGGYRVTVKRGATYRGTDLTLGNNTHLRAAGPNDPDRDPGLGDTRPVFEFVGTTNNPTVPDVTAFRTRPDARTSPPTIRNVAIEGISARAVGREDGNSVGNAFTAVLAQGGNIILRDCDFVGFAVGIVIQGIVSGNDPKTVEHRIDGVLIEDTLIADSHILHDSAGGPRSHSNGTFFEAVNHLVIHRCWFDHNGWSEVNGNYGTIFNHNIYINYTCTEAEVRNCGLTRASSHAAQLRSGGNFIDNFVDDCPMGVAQYDRPSLFRDNIVMRSGNIPNPLGGSPIPRGAGLEAKIAQNLRVVDSIFSKKTGGATNYAAVMATIDNVRRTTRQIGRVDPNRPATDEKFAVNDNPAIPSHLVISNLKVYDWPYPDSGGLWFRDEDDFEGRDSGTFDIRDVVVGGSQSGSGGRFQSPERFIEAYVRERLEPSATTKASAYDTLRNRLLARPLGALSLELTAAEVNRYIAEGYRLV